MPILSYQLYLMGSKSTFCWENTWCELYTRIAILKGYFSHRSELLLRRKCSRAAEKIIHSLCNLNVDYCLNRISSLHPVLSYMNLLEPLILLFKTYFHVLPCLELLFLKDFCKNYVRIAHLIHRFSLSVWPVLIDYNNCLAPHTVPLFFHAA